MFGDNTLVESATTGHECKPDPEEMLQRARKRKEKIQQDIHAYMGFDTYRINNDYALQFLGAMHLRLYQAGAEEQRWLDEIDKD